MFSELRALCCVYNPDIVCISESWLSSDINNYDNELTIIGYNLFRLDRNCHSGGFVLYAKASLDTGIIALGTRGLEFFLLSLRTTNCTMHIELFLSSKCEHCC